MRILNDYYKSYIISFSSFYHHFQITLNKIYFHRSFHINLFSVLPDSHYFVYQFLKKRNPNLKYHHHRWITHWPVTYLPLLLLLFYHQNLTIFLICFGLYSHLILDTFFGEGIMWLYPFCKRFVNFFGEKIKNFHGKEWFNVYRQLPIYKIDIAMFIIFLFLLVSPLFSMIIRNESINTDQWRGYDSLMFCGYKHLKVDHRYKFKSGKVYINGIEGFWSFAKERLIKHHEISQKYFLYYIKELELKYNNRNQIYFP